MQGKSIGKVKSFEKGDKHGAKGLPHGEDREANVAQALSIGKDKEDEEEDGDWHGGDEGAGEAAGSGVAQKAGEGNDEDGDKVLDGEGEPRVVEVSI